MKARRFRGQMYVEGVCSKGKRRQILHDDTGKITALKVNGKRRLDMPKVSAGVYIIQKSLGHRHQAR